MTVLITLVYIVVMVMAVLITLVYIYLTLMTGLITLVYIVVMVMTVCDSFGFLRRQWVTKCQPNGRRKKTLTSPNLSTTTWKRYSSLQSTCYNTASLSTIALYNLYQICPHIHGKVLLLSRLKTCICTKSVHNCMVQLMPNLCSYPWTGSSVE